MLLARHPDGALTQSCSATVVDSTTGDVVVTAAHCLSSGATLEFAPAYRPGTAPYGMWVVTSRHADHAWQDHSDDDDYAFLTVQPGVDNSRHGAVQHAVGGLPIGISPLIGDQVTVVGYPIKLAGRALTCRTRVRVTREFPTLDPGHPRSARRGRAGQSEQPGAGLDPGVFLLTRRRAG